jgi:guanylate kinase
MCYAQVVNTIEITRKIQKQRPRVVYLSGKTCTGKTTLASKLQQYEYSIIELDSIVTKSVIIPFDSNPGDGFISAYRDIGPKKLTQAFINAAKKEILKQSKSSPVIIEGAIGAPRILQEVFSDHLNNFWFIYLHPVSVHIYSKRIQERFIAGAATGTSRLPKHFWEMINQNDLNHFLSTGELNTEINIAIEKYAKQSILESKKRLELFQKEFRDIYVIEI